MRWSLLFVGLVGCASASGGSAPEGGAGAGSASGQGGAGGASGAAGGEAGAGGGVNLGGAGADGSDDCGGVGKVIYVVSSERVLLSFQPQTLAFTVIGTLGCPAGFGATPFSMAVDRDGMAFVLYSDGNIFLVNTADASCKPSGFKPGQGYTTFGMGYVSDSAGSQSETLFIIDYSSYGSGSAAGNKGLAYITPAGSVLPVGNFDGGLTGRPGEVTGLGDGRLFGFFVDQVDPSKTSVAEIDKTSGHVISNVPQNIQVGAWAFAHWGGAFYLFNSAGSGPSRVHKYIPDKGTTQIVANAGYEIVGAGVSTCAPLVEPPID